MSTHLFRSPLARRLQGFLETHRSEIGHGAATGKILRYLDHFLMGEMKPGQALSRDMVERFNESMAHLNPNTRINRLCVLRQFCRYLSHFDPKTCLVYSTFLPRRTRPAPYIYTHKDVRRIMAAARHLGPAGSLRPVIISTLIGFLYTTGIRIGEAIGLTLGDVNLRRRVIEIRNGKFGKSRYVPLSPSTLSHLKAYLDCRRNAGFSTASTAPVFPNIAGRRLGYPSFVTAFLQILRNLKLRRPTGERGPRVHDLRHTFAVNRLLSWYRHRDNLAAKLPLLSTYLGHSTVTGTEVYLHATAQLLERVGQRFHDHFALPSVTRTKHHAKT